MREALVPEPVGAARRVGVHLGAAYGSAKVWDPACVVELCRLLRARGTTVVLLGAASDVPVEEAVGRADRAPGPAARRRAGAPPPPPGPRGAHPGGDPRGAPR